MKKTVAKAKPTRMSSRYVAATGAPFSDEQAQVIGVELAKIASANAVDDIRSLDKRLVFEAVQRDPKHPLRQFYEWDESEAAVKHWLAHTGLLIRSVRIVHVTLGKRSKPQPMFLYDPDHPRRSPNEKTRRGHVLTEDALANDPAFASVLSQQIRMISLAVDRLEHVTSARPSPAEVVTLCESMRAALTAYTGFVASKAA